MSAVCPVHFLQARCLILGNLLGWPLQTTKPWASSAETLPSLTDGLECISKTLELPKIRETEERLQWGHIDYAYENTLDT